MMISFNTLRPRQNGHRLADDVFKCIFINGSVWISFKISLKFVPMVPINNIPALVQILAWRRSGDKPLSEPMMVSLLMHIWVTRSQWVKLISCFYIIRPVSMHPVQYSLMKLTPSAPNVAQTPSTRRVVASSPSYWFRWMVSKGLFQFNSLAPGRF